MTITIKLGEGVDRVNEAIDRLKEQPSHKAFNAHKYLGKLKKGVDGLDYQNKVRDAWR